MMTKINRRINQFVHWWVRELAFLIPKKLRNIVNENRGQLIVFAENNEVTLYLNKDSESEFIAKLPLNELGGEEYLALCNQDNRLLKADIILRLADTQAVKKILYLPAAADENLQQVIAYELDKYTPFKAEQVYFTVQQQNQDETMGQIKILLVLTPRATLDNICSQLSVWGMVPLIADSVLAPNDFEHSYDHYNLLPDWARQKMDTYSRILNPGISLLLFILLCGFLILPLWMQSQTVDLLQMQMQVVGKEAAKVENLRSETDQLQEETQQLISSKNASASTLAILESLSKLIADDTWLKHFKYFDGKIQIQGQSPGASSLIGLLEASPLFSDVRSRSPITQDKKSGLERFQIEAGVNQIETQNDVIQ